MRLKEQEREKVNKQLEKVMKKLEFDRSKKPETRTPLSSINTAPSKQRNDELILSPSMLSTNTPSVPRFDRNEKPTVNQRVYPEVIYNIEDFSPVFGKVVRSQFNQ